MKKPKILVVDDSPTHLKLISELLLAKGYEVVTASDGEEALAKAEAEHPVLMVLDVIMPKRNGFKVCRDVKTQSKYRGIKVILLTSKNQPSDKFWGEKQGADLYMTKPFTEEELASAIEKLL
jgi:twitching motility two-component system response regulator PilH